MQNHLCLYFEGQFHKRLWPWRIADGTVLSLRRKALQTNSHKGRVVCAATAGTEYLLVLSEEKQTCFTRKGDQIMRYNLNLLKWDHSLVWNTKTSCLPDFVLTVNIPNKSSHWESRLLHSPKFQRFSKFGGIFTTSVLPSQPCVHSFCISFRLNSSFLESYSCLYVFSLNP